MYSCLQSNFYEVDQYHIVPIREADIYQIKTWRNQQLDVLRQANLLTDDDQQKYYQDFIKPSFKIPFPQQILFSLLKNNELIGYGGIVHIAWNDKRGEISFLLNTSRAVDADTYTADFHFFLSLIKKVAFEDIKLNRIYTETFDIRPLHIGILEKNGFVLEGRMKQHVLINGQFVDSLIHGCLYEEYTKE